MPASRIGAALVPLATLALVAALEWWPELGANLRPMLWDVTLIAGGVSATLAIVFGQEASRLLRVSAELRDRGERLEGALTEARDAARRFAEAARRERDNARSQRVRSTPSDEPPLADALEVTEADEVEDEDDAPAETRGGTRRLPALEEARRVQQLRRLQRQVEILASMRDLSLIANDEAELETILTRSLDVLQRLFEATELQVFLCDGKAPDGLHLSAVRKQKRTTFATLDSPLRFQGARKDAVTAMVERRAQTRFVGQRLCAVSLLWGNQELIGVLVVYIPRRERGDEWASLVLAELVDLAKHVALVIHKPTLYDRAVLDALTGLYSKRHFLDQVPKAMAAARRLEAPLSLIVVDIDKFKSINDTHGHVTGDIVLAATARIIKDSIRGYDTAYRYGGEEMCVVAPNTDLEGAIGVAERIRMRLEEAELEGDQGQAIRVTASFGVAAFKTEMELLPAFVSAADAWLYKAKEEGRNQVRPHLTELVSKRKGRSRSQRASRRAPVAAD